LGSLIAQCRVDPERRTTGLIFCILMTSQLHTSKCSSPEGKCFDEAAQQREAVISGQVVGEAFGDEQYRTVGRDGAQPSGIGDAGRDGVVVLTGRIQLLHQRNDIGVVDVVPLDIGAGVEPKDAIVQPATEVQHHRAVVQCKESASPIVEKGAANDARGSIACRDAGLAPVVVDAAYQVLGEGVTEDRFVGVCVQRPCVQRREHRFRCPGEIDGDLRCLRHKRQASGLVHRLWPNVITLGCHYPVGTDCALAAAPDLERGGDHRNL
jgi:hypothetical protein